MCTYFYMCDVINTMTHNNNTTTLPVTSIHGWGHEMNGGGRWLPSCRPESRIEHGWDAACPCKISTVNKRPAGHVASWFHCTYSHLSLITCPFIPSVIESVSCNDSGSGTGVTLYSEVFGPLVSGRTYAISCPAPLTTRSFNRPSELKGHSSWHSGREGERESELWVEKVHSARLLEACFVGPALGRQVRQMAVLNSRRTVVMPSRFAVAPSRHAAQRFREIVPSSGLCHKQYWPVAHTKKTSSCLSFVPSDPERNCALRRSSSMSCTLALISTFLFFLKSFLTEEIGRQGVTCKTVEQSHRDVSTVHTHAYGAPPKSALPNTPTFTLRKNLASSHSRFQWFKGSFS